MAAGYKASVLASGLRTPRGIVLDSAGNLLVAETQGGTVRRLVLKEDGDKVCVDSSTTIVTGGTVSCFPFRWPPSSSPSFFFELLSDGSPIKRPTTAST